MSAEPTRPNCTAHEPNPQRDRGSMRCGAKKRRRATPTTPCVLRNQQHYTKLAETHDSWSLPTTWCLVLLGGVYQLGTAHFGSLPSPGEKGLTDRRFPHLSGVYQLGDSGTAGCPCSGIGSVHLTNLDSASRSFPTATYLEVSRYMPLGVYPPKGVYSQDGWRLAGDKPIEGGRRPTDKALRSFPNLELEDVSRGDSQANSFQHPLKGVSSQDWWWLTCGQPPEGSRRPMNIALRSFPNLELEDVSRRDLQDHSFQMARMGTTLYMDVSQLQCVSQLPGVYQLQGFSHLHGRLVRMATKDEVSSWGATQLIATWLGGGARTELEEDGIHEWNQTLTQCTMGTINAESLNTRLHEVVRLMEDGDHPPEILMVAEHRVAEAKQEALLQTLQQHQIKAHFTPVDPDGQRACGGVALFLKHGWRFQRDMDILDEWYHQGRVLAGRLISPNGTVVTHLMGIYSPTDPRQHRQECQDLWQAVDQWVQSMGRRPWVLMGDFNFELHESQWSSDGLRWGWPQTQLSSSRMAANPHTWMGGVLTASSHKGASYDCVAGGTQRPSSHLARCCPLRPETEKTAEQSKKSASASLQP